MEAYLAHQALPVESTWQQTTLLSFYAPRPPSVALDSGQAAALGGLTLAALLRDTSHPAYAAGWGIIPVGFAASNSQDLKRPAHVSVRLEDPQGVVWAAQDRELQTPEFVATHTWQTGLLVPAGTPPSVYRLTLTLYDAETQQPLGPALRVDDVSVVPPAVSPPIAALPIQTPLNAEWPDVRLLGYTLRAGPWRTGDALHADHPRGSRDAVDIEVAARRIGSPGRARRRVGGQDRVEAEVHQVERRREE